MIKFKLLLPLIGLFAIGHPGHVDAGPGDQPAQASPPGPNLDLGKLELPPLRLADATQTVPRVHRESSAAVRPQASPPIDIKRDGYVLPVVQLNAPSNVDIGEMIVVSAAVDKTRPTDNLQQVKFQWTVIEDGKIKTNVIVWPDASKIFFSAGLKPKTLVVFLDVDCLYGVAKTVDGASLLSDVQLESPDIMATTISVGGSIPDPDPPPGPAPGPNPPTPPPAPTFENGKYKLSAFTYNILKGNAAIADADKVKLGGALASTFDGIAAKIVAVADYKDPQKILTDLKAANVSAIKNSGVDPTIVSTFNQALGDRIYQLYSEDRTIVTAADFATAFREISIGFKAFTPSK